MSNYKPKVKKINEAEVDPDEVFDEMDDPMDQVEAQSGEILLDPLTYKFEMPLGRRDKATDQLEDDVASWPYGC